MLPAGKRLRRREEFVTAVRRGVRFGCRHLVVHFYVAEQVEKAETPEDPGHPRRAGHGGPSHRGPRASAEMTPAGSAARAGFIVSRAVGGAVIRNVVRRRLRHLVAERICALPPGSLLVVRALPRAADARSSELAADIDTAFSRLLRKLADTGKVP